MAQKLRKANSRSWPIQCGLLSVRQQIPGKLQVAHAQMPACIKGSYSPCTIADDSKAMAVCSQVLRRSSEKFSDGRQQFYSTVCFLRPSFRFSRTFKELRAIFRNSRIFKVLEKSFQNSRTFKEFKDPYGPCPDSQPARVQGYPEARPPSLHLFMAARLTEHRKCIENMVASVLDTDIAVDTSCGISLRLGLNALGHRIRRTKFWRLG